MTSESPKQRLLQAGRKTRDALRTIRDTVRQKRKANIYDETYAQLEESVESATDGLIEIAQMFEEVLRPGVDVLHPTSDNDLVDLRALQDDLAGMKAERDELIKSLQHAQTQLQKYADDLQVLYTQEREKRAELAEAYNHLKEANQLKADFLNTINHELSTPLVPVDLSLQLLEKSGLSQDQKSHLGSAQELLQKYKRQLDGIINYARLVKQLHVVSKEEIKVKPMLDETLHTLYLLARGRNITIDMKPIEEDLMVWADHELLGTLVYQIAHNGIKFNRPGGRLEIRVERAAGGGIEFTFSDDGPGFPPIVLERFGQDFNQIVDALRRGDEGLGLGLALSHHIASVHDGRLTADNAQPKGAIIKLWLPEGESA